MDLRSSLGNDGEKAKSISKEKKPVEKKAGRGFQRKPYAGQANYDKTNNDGIATGTLSNTKTMGCFIYDGS